MPKMVGSAVVFFHQHYREVHHPFPASFVQAVSLQELRTYNSQAGLEEKTICKVPVLGRYYPCLVLLIEPGRSLDEQAAIVLRDRSHLEERGRRWMTLVKDEEDRESEGESEAERDEEMEEESDSGSDTEMENAQAAPRASLPASGFRQNKFTNISSPFKRGNAVPHPTTKEPRPRKIINAVSVAPATPATNQRNRVMSEPRPNEITDGESESGDDDEEGEEEEENDVFDPRSKSMVSTIHKRSKKQMAYKDVQNMPKSARKPGPAKKGRRPVTASAVGKKLYPVAIPGVDGTMVNLENLVERMAAESSSKMKAAQMALTAIFPEEEIQTSVCSSRGSKAGAPSYDKDKLAALYECYREYARRGGIRMPDRRDFNQMCSKVKVDARKKAGLPALRSGRKSANASRGTNNTEQD